MPSATLSPRPRAVPYEDAELEFRPKTSVI
jgi:hypothetical protein